MRNHGKISTYRVSGCRCSPCTEANRLYQREYKRRVRNSAPLEDRGLREAIRKALILIKSGPCTDCRQSFHYAAMDFDHVKGEKLFELSQSHSRPLQEIIAEIDKCELVCSNCHRIRTFVRRQ